jgi:hypothetical protein
MSGRVDALVERIRVLQDQLEDEFSERREAVRYSLKNGRVEFEAEVRRRHRELRVRLGDFLRRTRPMTVVVAPVIYGLIVPFVFLDICVSLYQLICFPVYGIKRVRRSGYIHFDHRHLAYLNAVQKMNCIYCSYCNGLIGYVREIASRTEAFWCPIKHAGRVEGAHLRYPGFLEYGDAEGFREGLERSRDALTREG